MSDEGGRPGGLTVLAVLSFVWGGFCILYYAMFSMGLVLGDRTKMHEPYRSAPLSVSLMGTCGKAFCGVLLLIAGVGFLRRSPVLGRGMGTIYALVTLAILIVAEAMEPRMFDFHTVIFAVFALLIVVLVNTAFRRDFAR